MPKRAIVPNPDWHLRRYQVPAYRYIRNGGKRAVCVWHRRAGKETVAMHGTFEQMVRHPGVYWHMLPEREQARKSIWNNIVLNEVTGRRERQLDIVFPRSIRAETNKTEMRITLRPELGGATWYLVGSDSYNSLVGSNPRGIVFSEYAIADPTAWMYLAPILVENGGWAWFIYTPRGRNHGYTLYNAMRQSPENHVEILTVNDTQREDGSPVMTDADIRKLVSDGGIEEEAIEQEFYCSFAGVQMGSYFGKQIEEARRDGRITKVPHYPQYPVTTYWDCGIDDHTAVWFAQMVGFQARFIDYYETRDQGIEDVLFEITSDPRRKRYRYSRHHLPHDVGHRELRTGRGAGSILESQGWDIVIGENIRKADSIAAARLLLAHSWFDEERTEAGLNVLTSFQKKWDDKARTFLDTPLHNWASHGADAYMEAARNVYGGGEDDEKAPIRPRAQEEEPLTRTAPVGYTDDHFDPRGLREGPMQLYAEDDDV